MNTRILALLIVLISFAISTLVFAFIYHSYRTEDGGPFTSSFSSALYLSVTVQTSIGMNGPSSEHTEKLRNWITLQSIVTYLLSLGIILILVKTFFEKEDKMKELQKIQLEITDIKKMLSKSQSKR